MSHSFVTPQTIALQAPLSMGFSRQEYWSGLSLPAPGDLPSPGMEPMSPALAGRSFATEPPGKSPQHSLGVKISSNLGMLEVSLSWSILIYDIFQWKRNCLLEGQTQHGEGWGGLLIIGVGQDWVGACSVLWAGHRGRQEGFRNNRQLCLFCPCWHLGWLSQDRVGIKCDPVAESP